MIEPNLGNYNRFEDPEFDPDAEADEYAEEYVKNNTNLRIAKFTMEDMFCAVEAFNSDWQGHTKETEELAEQALVDFKSKMGGGNATRSCPVQAINMVDCITRLAAISIHDELYNEGLKTFESMEKPRSKSEVRRINLQTNSRNENGTDKPTTNDNSDITDCYRDI
ncbi:hypothetical protein KAR91_16650 [Candidatus Pacearchaeota archaeon]|nr:hypothetical protein [Candidatus Pacearchaeota archaeon]